MGGAALSAFRYARSRRPGDRWRSWGNVSIALEAALAEGFDPLSVYRVLFAACAAASAFASVPLRAFAKRNNFV